MSLSLKHLSEELEQTGERISIITRFGRITGGRALNGAAAFLEIPYALPPDRFCDPKPLPLKYRYEDKEYVHESQYAVQPDNDGQAGGEDPTKKLGLGRPTENPLFLNIVTPPSFPSKRGFPVKIYIHGGFLQFGSPHGINSQAQYIAAERGEIFVNVGYRLSAFGFLASDEPHIAGNFGFKDQWLALEWIRDSIGDFGGDPNNVQVTGLSAGAHSVHQLLHHVSLLPPGVKSPFQSALLQSNAIATNPKTPMELRPQYQELLKSLDLDPSSQASYITIRDVSRSPWEDIVKHIAASLVAHGTFRGTSDGVFLPTSPSEMTWQTSGAFSKRLREAGIRSIVVGDLSEEWYLYSLAHPINCPRDIQENLKRYYSDDLVTRLLTWYPQLSPMASKEECARLFGEILSDGQVHLPVRLLHRDLQRHGFPVLRYQIHWTPPQCRPRGYVTHGTDRTIWSFRRDVLTDAQIPIARAWLKVVDDTTKEIEDAGINSRPVDQVLTLKEDGTIGWGRDERWKEMNRLAKVVQSMSNDALMTRL